MMSGFSKSLLFSSSTQSDFFIDFFIPSADGIGFLVLGPVLGLRPLCVHVDVVGSCDVMHGSSLGIGRWA